MTRREIVDVSEALEAAVFVEALGIRVERVEIDPDACTFACYALCFVHEATAETMATPCVGDPKIADVEPPPMRRAVDAADEAVVRIMREKGKRSFIARAEAIGDVLRERVRDLCRRRRVGRVRHHDADGIGFRRFAHRAHIIAGIAALCVATGCPVDPARANGALVCHAPARIEPPSGRSVAPLTRVQDYRAIYKACRTAGGDTRLALRSMMVDSKPILLTIDPITLATTLEDARVWSCADTTDEAQAATRFGRALISAPPFVRSSGIFRDEGLVHGATDGVFVTGDLCPSHRPLDRAFLEMLAQSGARTPIALSISGLWLAHHADDFHWLQEQSRNGALAITWVNHSFTHPFDPWRPIAQDFLLRPGIDLAAEILDTERLLIAQGETPSAFFRFPALVANAALVDAVRAFHLIVLGADSWLVLSPTVPRDGAIILVHPNGNEPGGLRLFSRYRDAGRLPKPFRAITDAPAP